MLAVVKDGRVPVCICNLNEFSVSIGRYQKIGRLYQVDDADAHDFSLTPDVDNMGLVEASGEPEQSPDFDAQKLIDWPDLTEKQQGRLAALLFKWEHVFSNHEEDFDRSNAVKHPIPTDDACPMRERFRPLPPLMSKELRSLLTDMLEGRIITESSSPWATPIVMVKKEDGSWGFCVDYRNLNSVTHKDVFPLRRIEETLISLTKAEWFSTQDPASGYWQIEVDPKDCEKTAFTTPLGL